MPIYMQYDGVPGTVRRGKETWIELLGAEFGVLRGVPRNVNAQEGSFQPGSAVTVTMGTSVASRYLGSEIRSTRAAGGHRVRT
jgi:hypothetical protein